MGWGCLGRQRCHGGTSRSAPQRGHVPPAPPPLRGGVSRWAQCSGFRGFCRCFWNTHVATAPCLGVPRRAGGKTGFDRGGGPGRPAGRRHRGPAAPGTVARHGDREAAVRGVACLPPPRPGQRRGGREGTVFCVPVLLGRGRGWVERGLGGRLMGVWPRELEGLGDGWAGSWRDQRCEGRAQTDSFASLPAGCTVFLHSPSTLPPPGGNAGGD